jgi:hypothetical protein
VSDREFLKLISPDGQDRLRIKIRTEKGKVVNIVVQYEAMIKGAWHEIVRYDCEHGYFHRDVIYPRGRKEKQPIAIENLNDALQYAEQDLKDRWTWYKDRYKRRLKE